MKQVGIQKAVVESINDPDEIGRIQVRILPEMIGVDNDLLPWVRPFNVGGMTRNEFSFNPPPENSRVWVMFIDKYYKKGYYLSGQHIDGFFSYVTAKNKAEQTGESGTAYPNLKFYMMEDGGLIFYNTQTGNMGAVHKDGSYVYLQGNSIVLNNGTGMIEMQSNGTVDINGNLTVSV